MPYQKLLKAASILAILVLIVVILVYAGPFLIPFTFAGLLAMLLLPIVRYLQRKNWNRVLAVIVAMLVLVGCLSLIVFFVGWQLTDLLKDASKIEQQLTEKYQQVQTFITEKLGIPPQEQQKMMKEQQASAPGKLGSMITGFLAGLGGFLTDFILTLVYIFLLLYFRGHIRRFILRIVSRDEKPEAEAILNNSQKVAQKYLTGMGMMIVTLWIMYGIGFTIAGVKNALFFAVLCGVLELIPFVGNLLGTTLTLSMSLIQGGDMNLVIGILITYACVQFIQTYILEPLIVGSEVNINPLFTIIGLVVGELLWGIPGMVLAIPLLGIAKIICDHVPPLKPYGFLIGENKPKNEKGLREKIQSLFSRKK